MKTITTAVAGIAAAALAVALAGCASKTDTATSEGTTSAAAAAGSGDGLTLNQYIVDNDIAEYPFKDGDPGTPDIEFPFPPDWRPAGDLTPSWAFGAIIYDKAKDPADPPFMTAIVNKLTGDVEAAKILEYAPGLLQNLPGYQPSGEVQKTTLSGFDGIVFEGSYLRDETRRYIAQLTAVVPGKDGALFVLQLNADAPEDQAQVIRDAAKVIQSETTITA